MAEEYTLKGIDIAPNSHKSKEEKKEKHLPKVAQAKQKKKSLGRKFSETFIKSDAESVGSYIFFDVLVPAIVDTFRDIINSSLDMFLYGDTRGRGKSGPAANRNKSYVSYRDYYETGRRKEAPAVRSHSYKDMNDEVIFESRAEAEETVDAMINLIETYDMVSVREFREMVGLDFEFTDEKYGWTNLSNVSVSRTRDGYVINLPRPILLD